LTEKQERQQRRQIFLWRLVLQYGIGFIVLVFFVTASLHFRYTPDDTYVYLQYAKNIAGGDGFSFNAGNPSYGVAGPLWAFLIAAGMKLNLDPYIVAKTLDIVFAGFSIIGVLAFAFVLMRDRIYALVAAWIFSVDAWFLRWSGSGMESSIAVLLVMLTLWYAYKKEYITSALVAGLLTLVRPEGMLLFVAVLVDRILNGRERAAVIRTIVASVLLYGTVVGSWWLYSWMQFGTVVPNVFLTKPADGSGWWGTVLSNLSIIGATQCLMALFLVVGVIVAFRRSEWRTLREDSFPLLWVLLVPLFYVVTNVQVVSRYLLLILPVIVIYGVWGIKRLEVASMVSPQRGLLVLLVVAGLSLAQNQFVYRKWIVPHMETFEVGTEECLRPIAYWLRSNSLPGSSVLAPDIGVLGYVSERTMFDTAGLVTPDVSRAFSGAGYDEGMKQRSYEQVVHPDYVVDRSPVPDRLASASLVPVMTRTFSSFGLRKPGLEYYTLYKVMR
jgi:hypothetical protein